VCELVAPDGSGRPLDQGQVARLDRKAWDSGAIVYRARPGRTARAAPLHHPQKEVDQLDDVVAASYRRELDCRARLSRSATQGLVTVLHPACRQARPSGEPGETYPRRIDRFTTTRTGLDAADARSRRFAVGTSGHRALVRSTPRSQRGRIIPSRSLSHLRDRPRQSD
jgi:hypothetical protein